MKHRTVSYHINMGAGGRSLVTVSRMIRTDILFCETIQTDGTVHPEVPPIALSRADAAFTLRDARQWGGLVTATRVPA